MIPIYQIQKIYDEGYIKIYRNKCLHCFFSNFFDIIIPYQLHICYLCCNPQSILYQVTQFQGLQNNIYAWVLLGTKQKFFWSILWFYLIFLLTNHFKPIYNIKKVEFCPLNIFLPVPAVVYSTIFYYIIGMCINEIKNKTHCAFILAKKSPNKKIIRRLCCEFKKTPRFICAGTTKWNVL